ncbi:MAG TPA: mismatch-specific DNA-glycosylase [Acidimicrobiales bacterium]
MNDLDVPAAELPMALARLHWAIEPGAPVDLRVQGWAEDALRDVVTGAGFDVDAVDVDGGVARVRATRALSLPDTVDEGMRLLVCGLNPSVYAAERGVGFARPSNRFWRAATEAGLVSRERDTEHALLVDRVGMTDLCKRATAASAELTTGEYRAGAARVERLVEWLRPRAVVFVGLEGWRAAIDKQAMPGVQPRTFGGRPAYVMPSTSGLNAHSRLEHLVDHLNAAARVADTAPE